MTQAKHILTLNEPFDPDEILIGLPDEEYTEALLIDLEIEE